MDIHSYGDFYYYVGVSDFHTNDLAHLPSPCTDGMKFFECKKRSKTSSREEIQKEWAKEILKPIKTENSDKVIEVNFTQYPCFRTTPSEGVHSGARFSGTADTWAFYRGAKYAGTWEVPGQEFDRHSIYNGDFETNSDYSNAKCGTLEK